MTWDGMGHDIGFTVKNLPEGQWALYQNGTLSSTSSGTESRVREAVSQEGETDIVIVKT